MRPPSRSTRAGSTSQSKRSASAARAEDVIAVRPKNGTAIPSFIFWSASIVRWRPVAAPDSAPGGNCSFGDQLAACHGTG